MSEMKPSDLLRAGDLAAAAKLAEETLAAEPANAEALHILGLHALAMSKLVDACKHLDSATANAPESAWYWCNLGHARLQHAKIHKSGFDGAIDASRRALELR